MAWDGRKGERSEEGYMKDMKNDRNGRKRGEMGSESCREGMEWAEKRRIWQRETRELSPSKTAGWICL